MDNIHTILQTHSLNTGAIELKEKTLHDVRTSNWFDTFLKYTNEKSIVGKHMKDFVLKHIDDRTGKLVLDIGCGEGELAGYIVDGFRDKSNVKYWGIDNDAQFLQRASDLLITKNVSADFINGSCFNEDMNSMPYNADLIIGSHVAYYATNMKTFIGSLVSHLSPSGAIMLMHAPQSSDQNILRTTYGAHVDVHTVSNIKSIVDEMPSLKLETSIIESQITFPDDTIIILGEIKSLSNDEVLYELSSNQTMDLKDLLEFTIQRPLESMADYDLLHDYLDHIHCKLVDQNNNLHLKDEVQIITFNMFDFASTIDSVL